jgi:hypothetical protein
LLLTLLVAGGTVAEAGPRVEMAEPGTFDFGTVDRGVRVEHTFRLRNGGDADLYVDHVKGSCGCTAAVISTPYASSGGEARILVSLDTGRMTGRTTKTVTVYTNDAEAPAIGLTLTGQVVADLVVTPSPLYLGRLRRGDPGTREVLIGPGRTDATYEVTAVEAGHPGLRAVVARDDEPAKQRLLVSLDPDMPLGRFNAQMVLRTTSPREPVVALPVFGSVEGDVLVLPPQVTFGVARRGATPKRELYLRNRAARPLTITGVAVPRRLVTFRLKTLEEGREYRLTLQLRPGLPTGRVEGSVEIFTDNPDEARVVVPLYAVVRSARRRG